MVISRSRTPVSNAIQTVKHVKELQLLAQVAQQDYPFSQAQSNASQSAQMAIISVEAHVFYATPIAILVQVKQVTVSHAIVGLS